VLGGAGNSSCFALACGQARARKPAGAGFQVNSQPIKTVPQSTLVGLSALENATIPPQNTPLLKTARAEEPPEKSLNFR